MQLSSVTCPVFLEDDDAIYQSCSKVQEGSRVIIKISKEIQKIMNMMENNKRPKI